MSSLPSRIIACCLLFWGCFDLNLVVELAEPGKTASLEIDYVLGEDLYALNYSAEEGSSLRALPLPLMREDFLALLAESSQAGLSAYQRRDNRVQAQLNFLNNQEMIDFLNQQQLGVWQLSEDRLDFQLKSFGDIPFDTGSHYLRIELNSSRKLNQKGQEDRKRKLNFQKSWNKLAQEGLQFSVSW